MLVSPYCLYWPYAYTLPTLRRETKDEQNSAVRTEKLGASVPGTGGVTSGRRHTHTIVGESGCQGGGIISKARPLLLATSRPSVVDAGATKPVPHISPQTGEES